MDRRLRQLSQSQGGIAKPRNFCNKQEIVSHFVAKWHSRIVGGARHFSVDSLSLEKSTKKTKFPSCLACLFYPLFAAIAPIPAPPPETVAAMNTGLKQRSERVKEKCKAGMSIAYVSFTLSPLHFFA